MVARRFGYHHSSLRSLCSAFRKNKFRDFFQQIPRGPKTQPKKDAVRNQIITLRKQNYSIYDIRDELDRQKQGHLGITAIHEVLKDEGFSRLPRRGDDERPKRPQPTADAIADVREFSVKERIFSTRMGGLFLLIPLLARLDIDSLVKNWPGTRMIPASHAVRSALILKLIGKSRRSHVMDLLFDEGIALACGLNAIPKATFMSQYSSRLGRNKIADLLGLWIGKLKQEKGFDFTSLNLDFHSISYFGNDPFVEKHYVPRRSQRRKSVLTFFAQDAEGQVFCYSNADLRKGEEAGEVLRFVSFWKKKYGEKPKELVFDSKLTTSVHLSKLNRQNISFITLRRRSPGLKKEAALIPRADWKTVTLDVPHRKYKTPRVVEQTIRLDGYDGDLRQFIITDLGHDEPTILITNDFKSSPKKLITRYARRMLIENGLADAVDFFHLDALSSAVALNVDFDVLLTVIAGGIYRIFAKSLRGYERSQGRQIFRRFLDTPARVVVSGDTVTVHLPRRAHNPILIDSGVINASTKIPWWNGRKLNFEII